MFRSILSVDLIRTYAEASNDNQILCLSQDPGCELRLRTYTNHVHVSAFGQFNSLERNRGAGDELPHRILLINSSSGREDLRAST